MKWYLYGGLCGILFGVLWFWFLLLTDPFNAKGWKAHDESIRKSIRESGRVRYIPYMPPCEDQ